MAELTMHRSERTGAMEWPDATLRFPDNADCFTTESGLRVTVCLNAEASRDLVARLGTGMH
jgi:hypothetical protein